MKTDLATGIRSHRRPPDRRSKRVLTALVAVAALLLSMGGVQLTRPTPAQAAAFTTPMRAMFLYDDSFRHANDHYQPILSPYDDTNPIQVGEQLGYIKDLGMQATIMTWWGPGQHGEQATMPVLYEQAAAKGLGVIPYYEPEGQGDPTVAQIQSHLDYLHAYVDAYPNSSVKIGGKPVIFVYNAGGSSCAEVAKWSEATYGFTEWYVNLKVFSGFRTCPVQPSSWHQYGPANPDGQSVHLPWSFNISPGFWKYTESTPRLVRDPARWALNISNMVASGAQWQLVTSWGELGEGTSVEPLVEFPSASGLGIFGDELRRQLVGSPSPAPTGPPAPSPSTTLPPTPSPTVTVTSSPTSNPTPTCDADDDECPTPGPTPSTTPSPSPTSLPPSPTSTTTSPTTPTSSPTPTPSPPGPNVEVMFGADIVAASGNGYTSSRDGYTAEIVTKYAPDAVLGGGDLQYEEGTLAQYQAGWGRMSCYTAAHCDAWGKHMGVMYPAPGNHEWLDGRRGYDAYFGDRLRMIGSDTQTANLSWYSFDIGAWHVASLDSNCSKVGGCSSSSPQGQWLAADLAANDGRPTILFFHHPRWSSGAHGNITGSDPFWRAAVNDLDVQMVLNGHDHWMEGFEPLGIDGLPSSNGVREFVVGTGGKNFTCGSEATIRPGSEAHQCTSMGLLHLTLNASSYSWSFRPISEVGGPGVMPKPYAGTSGLRLPAGLTGMVTVTSTAITTLGRGMYTRLHLLARSVRPTEVKAGKR